MRRAVEASGQAVAAADEISAGRNAAAGDIRYLLTQAEAVRRSNDAQAAAYEETANDVAGASAKAEAWAEASWLWAEHMPDTLPDNAVKIMDISGDHWSSRWWANRADNAFGRLTDLYLGAWPDPPTTNLEGGPITVGSIYYNTDTGQMYVWDGANWQSMTQPQRAATAALWYEATAGQTVFPFCHAGSPRPELRPVARRHRGRRYPRQWRQADAGGAQSAPATGRSTPPPRPSPLRGRSGPATSSPSISCSTTANWRRVRCGRGS